MVGAETRALPQPVGAPRLGFYLHLYLGALEGEVKQRVLPELSLRLLLYLGDRAVVPVLRRLNLIGLALFVLHVILLLLDPGLLAVLSYVFDLLDELLDIGQVFLVGLAGAEGVVKNGALQLGLLRYLLALGFLPVA